MPVDSEILIALKSAIADEGQTEAFEKALIAWLNAMSDSELDHGDHRRHLESVKHAVRLDTREV